MAYQTPKADHPWRQYKDREPKKVEKKEKKVKPVRLVVEELVEGWETIEITTFAYGREGKFYLKELPQRRQAAWLASFLKRHYL